MSTANQNTPNASVAGSRFDYGYVIIIASSFITMVTVGMFLSIGIFFKPILNDLHWTRAETSGAIAISVILTGISGIIVGWLTDKLGPRITATICGLISGLGYIMMSQLTEIWQLYIYLGLLIGVGSGINSPLLSIVPRWFTKRRTVMAGIISSGGAIGGLAMPLVSDWLISTYEWEKAYLIIGIAFLLISVTAAQFLKRSPALAQAATSANRASARSLRPMSLLSTLKEAALTRNFWFILVQVFAFGFVALTINVHLANHATDIGIDPTGAAGFLSILNGISIVGCIILGVVGDRYGNNKLLFFTFLIEAIALFSLIYIHEYWMFVVFVCIYGVVFGSGLAQVPPLVARVFGVGAIGFILGMITMSQTLGGSVGSYLVGFIYDTNQSYNLAFIICSVLLVLALAATLLIRLPKHKTYTTQAHGKQESK